VGAAGGGGGGVLEAEVKGVAEAEGVEEETNRSNDSGVTAA